MFSLSAEQMSRRDELNCYNLSLINEGFSFPAYWNFTESLSLDRNKINYIFYSSMVSELDEDYYFEKLNNAKLAIGISGKNSLSFSGKSLASYIFDLIKYGEFKVVFNFPCLLVMGISILQNLHVSSIILKREEIGRI